MLFFYGKCMDGEVLRVSLERVSGWCKDMGQHADGRSGADRLKDSRVIRVSPLQLISARKGIQVVPRNLFVLNAMRLGRFFLRSVNYGKRITKGVRAPANRGTNL